MRFAIAVSASLLAFSSQAAPWIDAQEHSRLTDQAVGSPSIAAPSTPIVGDDQALLYVVCADTPEVLITFPGRTIDPGVGEITQRRMDYRVDTSPAANIMAGKLSGALFVEDGDFVKRVLRARRLYVESADMYGQKLQAQFDLEDPGNLKPAIFKACHLL